MLHQEYSINRISLQYQLVFVTGQGNTCILVRTSNRTLSIHDYNGVQGLQFQWLVALEPITNKCLNWNDFVMQYVIITVRQVIFSDASTSGFKSELIIRSRLHTFVAILMLFLKVLLRIVLTRC